MNRSRPHADRLAVLMLTLSLGSAVGASATAAEADDDAESSQAPIETQDDSAASGNASSEPSTEVFIPTEEISEDFAVSFPVDI